jgi:hypothetical protein
MSIALKIRDLDRGSGSPRYIPQQTTRGDLGCPPENFGLLDPAACISSVLIFRQQLGSRATYSYVCSLRLVRILSSQASTRLTEIKKKCLQ